MAYINLKTHSSSKRRSLALFSRFKSTCQTLAVVFSCLVLLTEGSHRISMLNWRCRARKPAFEEDQVSGAAFSTFTFVARDMQACVFTYSIRIRIRITDNTCHTCSILA